MMNHSTEPNPTRETHSSSAADLRSPRAIRAGAETVLAFVAEGKSVNFSVHFDRLESTVDFVLAVMQRNYPTGDIPFHSRWRHFDSRQVNACLSGLSGRSRAESALELAIVSVLLDAGAGGDWSYCDRQGRQWSRSEGLAIASLEAFAAGQFGSPQQVTGPGLSALSQTQLAHLFQVSQSNPMVGLAGRWGLLQRLACKLGNQRLASLLHNIIETAIAQGEIPATDLLTAVLQQFGEIWSDGLILDGINVGDVGQHSTGLVPFHKLSQWLTYSLMEPFIDLGIRVIDLNALTGLAEYRNGGLFLDCGVLALKDPTLADRQHSPTSELIVEWRACTLALLDQLADRIRLKLNQTEETLPLVKILQGGTWSAGREIARSRRPSGEPPLKILSDGTIF
jgi:Protein of unknown function (DUF1688)